MSETKTLSVHAATEALVLAARRLTRIQSDLDDSRDRVALRLALKAYDDAKQRERDMLMESNRRLNEWMRSSGLFTMPTPAYRYFEHKGVRYCWNTKPLAKSAPMPWASWEYRPLKDDKLTLEKTHSTSCRTRKRAKQLAYDRYRKAQGLEPVSLS